MPYKDPATRRAADNAYRRANRELVRGRQARWAGQNKEKVRRGRWRAAGLPTPTRPIPETCELCAGPPNGRGGLHLDHCHVTGAFRGWLCSNCNVGLGKLGDSLEGLALAKTYLMRHASGVAE